MCGRNREVYWLNLMILAVKDKGKHRKKQKGRHGKKDMVDGKAVIFDMDGIIFDSERLVLDCWERLAEQYHLKNMHEAYLPCIGTNDTKTREIMMNYYGADFPYDRFRKESSVIFHEIVDRDGLPVKKGVRELLEFLKAERIPVGLASSTRLAVVTEELKQAGLYDFFHTVTGGDQLKRSKPEPDIYLTACEKLGVRPEDTYAVEDSYNGIRAAYSAGMMPVMVPDLLPPTEEMRQKSVIVLEDLLQVRDWFRNR